MEYVWPVSGITAAATKEGCETATHQDTSKDFFLSLVYSREEMQDAKGVVGRRALFVGLDRKKGVCSGRGGLLSPFGAAEVEDYSLGCSWSRGRFKHHNSALDCQLWSTRRANAFAVQENGLLKRCCAMQCRMQDAKCEESRGFRKGRKKGRAVPRTGSTECRYRYRYGHHSGLLRPGGILGS